MFPKLIQVFLILTIFPLEIFSQGSNLTQKVAESVSGYEVTGRIKGLKEGGKVVFYLFYNGSLSRRDSGYVRNGEFHIQGFVPDGPRDYWVYADTDPQHPFLIRFFIDNGEHISIEGDLNKIDHGVVDQWLDIRG